VKERVVQVWGRGSIVVVGLLGASSPASVHARGLEPEPVEGVVPVEDRRALRWAVLRVEGRAWADVRDELAPRLPGVEILPFEDATFATIGGQLFAYVELVIEPGPAADVELTIVLSDRRAYLRSFTPERSRPLRSIATTVANTLTAIEQEALQADREVDVPRPSTAPAEPEPAPAEPTLAPAEPAPAEPTTAAPSEATEPAPAEPAPLLSPPPFELGLTLAGQLSFGLAPSTVRGLAALGGEARVSARQRRGLLLELGLRVSGRGRDGHRLWRSRLQLAAGYAWRSGSFGVAAVAGPTVEPWAIRTNGVPQTITPLGDARATPLWGAAAAVTPGLYRPLSPNVTLRVALRVELAASVLGAGRAGRVLDRPADPPGPVAAPRVLFTLGGLEASTGLELTLWIAPPRSAMIRPD
jgi:hypothetical protein